LSSGIGAEFAVQLAAQGVNLVLDGTDDFAVRYEVNAACVRHDKPLVSGAIGRWTGQVGVFGARPCYRCLVPEMPAREMLFVVPSGAPISTMLSLLRSTHSCHARTPAACRGRCVCG
jgi:molybdopterin/thiamine biosynthesis adenylyltransferase